MPCFRTDRINMLHAEHILTLLNLPGFGKKTVQHIIDDAQHSVSSSDELLNLIEHARITKKRIKMPTNEALFLAAEKTEQTVLTCENLGISMIGYKEEHYPLRYNDLSDPPVLLFAKGDTSALHTDLAVAIIGTREPTSFGSRAGQRLAELFTQEGFVVVSGLAKGCDTVAHKGCLQARGQTVAILGSGLDYIYPKENKELAEKIIDQRGCLLAEYMPGTRPRPNFFVERDRLQSGLSQAVVVIESDVKGGSMHTVGFAQKQGRLVACMGGHPQELANSPKIQGNAKLIAEGTATRLGDPDEIRAFISTLKQPEHNSTLEQPEQSHPTTPDSGAAQGKLF